MHLPAGWEKFVDPWVPKCGKPATVVYTNSDHPEWKPSYRCADHTIAARDNLIERAI
jgi:hypothetical protein